MDKIDFGCVKSELEDYMTTLIYINGIDLKHIVEGIEAQQFAQKGLTIQNGSYEGISFFIAFHNQDHFLCKTLHDYVYQEEQYTLFDYKYSGIPGDHSLTCKIAIGSEEIVWYDFKNFSKIIPFELEYGNLQFRFSTKQYREAIDVIKNDSAENMFA